jgi:hypothetical protein
MYTLVTMRHVRFAVLGAGLALGAACGGGSGSGTAAPTGAAALPTPTPAPVAVAPEVRNGETGGPVGAAVASPAQVVPGAAVAVTAPGFLRRQQFFVGGAPIFLWPQEEAYVRAIVYAGGSEGGPYGLIRWTGGFRVKPWPGTEDKIAIVVAEAVRVSGLPITMTTSGAADVEFVLDPAEPALAANALAVTFRTYSGLTITHSRIVFRNLGEFLGNNLKNGGRTNTALHEMGHVLGLDHSMSYHDVMSNENDRNPGLTYGTGEELAVRMMYAYRAAGNAFPDRASGVPTATALRTPPSVVVD